MVKSLPVHEVFAYIMHKRMSSKVEYKMQIYMSEVVK